MAVSFALDCEDYGLRVLTAWWQDRCGARIDCSIIQGAAGFGMVTRINISAAELDAKSAS